MGIHSRFIIFLSILFGIVAQAKDSDIKAPKSIDREGIRLAIRTNLNAFEKCHKEALTRDSQFQGKVEMEWNITDDGTAENVKVANAEMTDPKFENCMIAAFSQLKFPRPPKDQLPHVKYPFVFASQ